MIYELGFHSLLGSLKGNTLRNMADRVYGARCLAAERVAEPRTKLLIDCRFLRHQCVTRISTTAK